MKKLYKIFRTIVIIAFILAMLAILIGLLFPMVTLYPLAPALFHDSSYKDVRFAR